MYLAILLSVGLLFWAFDGHTIVWKKWNDFRRVNALVETKYKTIGMIVWISIKMIAKMYWINFLQWANNTIHHRDKHTVEISYMHKGRMYTISITPHRGPPSVLLVTDENWEDVSDEVLPFLGAGEDWHGNEFTPSYWGKETLTFEMAMDGSKTFSKDEVIKLKTG
uniref:Uncharacterized protein n=1 Tax=viral metagenome TaxID=1070528 RepID=A0A6C0EQH5_9ZZZZ